MLDRFQREKLQYGFNGRDIDDHIDGATEWH